LTTYTIIANASQSSTFAGRTSQCYNQNLQKSLPTQTHGQEKMQQKMKDRISKDKNGQLVTKAKIKRADSANLKGIATNKLNRKLTAKCSEMPASF
jgi:hypothetical protein